MATEHKLVDVAQNTADSDTPDELTELLAERTGEDPEEIERAAASAEIEDPEDAHWEFAEEDWEDSPAYQEY